MARIDSRIGRESATDQADHTTSKAKGHFRTLFNANEGPTHATASSSVSVLTFVLRLLLQAVDPQPYRERLPPDSGSQVYC
jgi:hypothetical protein